MKYNLDILNKFLTVRSKEIEDCLDNLNRVLKKFHISLNYNVHTYDEKYYSIDLHFGKKKLESINVYFDGGGCRTPFDINAAYVNRVLVNAAFEECLDDRQLRNCIIKIVYKHKDIIKTEELLYKIRMRWKAIHKSDINTHEITENPEELIIEVVNDIGRALNLANKKFFIQKGYEESGNEITLFIIRKRLFAFKIDRLDSLVLGPPLSFPLNIFNFSDFEIAKTKQELFNVIIEFIKPNLKKEAENTLAKMKSILERE